MRTKVVSCEHYSVTILESDDTCSSDNGLSSQSKYIEWNASGKCSLSMLYPFSKRVRLRTGACVDRECPIRIDSIVALHSLVGNE